MTSDPPPAPAPDVAAQLGMIVDGLCRAVAARAHKASWTRPTLLLLWPYLRRLLKRFEALAARVRAGRAAAKPPRPRASPAAPARSDPPAASAASAPAAVPRLPGGFGWLMRLLPYEAACFGSQLQHFLAKPDMAAMLDAAPQTRRMLRPLCQMLGVTLPPPPPAAPRPLAATTPIATAATDALPAATAGSPPDPPWPSASAAWLDVSEDGLLPGCSAPA